MERRRGDRDGAGTTSELGASAVARRSRFTASSLLLVGLTGKRRREYGAGRTELPRRADDERLPSSAGPELVRDGPNHRAGEVDRPGGMLRAQDGALVRRPHGARGEHVSPELGAAVVEDPALVRRGERLPIPGVLLGLAHRRRGREPEPRRDGALERRRNEELDAAALAGERL